MNCKLTNNLFYQNSKDRGRNKWIVNDHLQIIRFIKTARIEVEKLGPMKAAFTCVDDETNEVISTASLSNKNVIVVSNNNGKNN